MRLQSVVYRLLVMGDAVLRVLFVGALVLALSACSFDASLNPLEKNLVSIGDTTPSITLTSPTPDFFSTPQFTVGVTFALDVQDFTLSDLQITNGTASDLTGSGKNYSFTVTPSTAGVVTVDLDETQVTNDYGVAFLNTASLNRTYDFTRPSVTLTSTTPPLTIGSTILVSAEFSENITGFDLSDVTVTNGIVTGFSGSGASYSLVITPILQGAVGVSLGADVAQDLAGNLSEASSVLSFTFDNIAPMPTLASTAPSYFTTATFTVTATFLEDVTDFELSDVVVTNGTVTDLTGSGASYSFTVTPSGQGLVTVAVGAEAVQDATGNLSLAATSLTRTYDSLQPTLALSSAVLDPFNTASFAVTATFSEDVTGFALGDLNVTNGTASAFSGSGSTYTFTVTPSGQGLVTVAVNAGVAQDIAGNHSQAATNLTRTYDTVLPTLNLSSAEPDPSYAPSFTVTATFSEDVTGFTIADIAVTNGTASALIGSGTTYTFTVTPSAQGLVTVSVGAGAAQDLVGNASLAATNLTRTYDSTSPGLALSSAAPSHFTTSSFEITATFSKPVTGFALGDVTVTNGTASSLSGSGSSYSFTVTPTAQGLVTVAVAAGAAQDAGNNQSTAAVDLTRTYDTTQPTLTLSSSAANPFNTPSFTVTATFLESVTDFELSDISVTNGTASALSGSGTTYTFTVTPSAQGLVTVAVAAGAAQDAAGNNSQAATNLTRTYDSAQPTLTLSSAAVDPFNSATISVTATFSESVTGFALGDISVTNGIASALSGSGTTYTFTVTLSAQGLVTVAVAAGAAQDAAGNTSQPATDLTRNYDSVLPTVLITSSAPAITNTSPIPITVTFSENVTGFDSSDINVSNGVITGFSGSGSNYTLNITPLLQGAVNVNIAAGVASDAAGNLSQVATQLTRTFDTLEPTVTLTSASPDPTDTVAITATFNEDVTGFNAGEIAITGGGTISNFTAVDARTYTFTAAPTTQGSVNISVPAAVANDAAGNTNMLSNTLNRNIDLVTLTVTSMTTDPQTIGPFTVNITFSENVTGLAAGDFTVTNGTVSSVSGSGTTYAVNISPSLYGTVTVQLNANTVADVVNNVGPSTSSSVSTSYVASWAHQAYLKAPNAEAGDTFGTSLSISGDTIVVGASVEDSNQTTITNGSTASADNTGTDVGAAYVFRRSGANWTHEAYLKAPNAGANDQFGYSLSISGDTIVVGAIGEDSNQTTITNGSTASADNTGTDVGAAYVFRRSGANWTHEAYLKAPNAGAYDNFGKSLSISGDTIVVAARDEDSNQTTITNGSTASADNSATDAGAAYVFRRSGSNWTHEAYLKAPNAGAYDLFGYSLSISGDTIVVGTIGEDSNQTTITNGSTASTDNSATDAGAAYVFRRSGANWTHEAYLKVPNAGGSDYFSTSLGISGDTIVVGANYEDSNQTTITNGSTASSDNSASASGAAYVFRRSGSTWTHEAYLKAPNAGANDQFGYSLSISGDTIVVGAIGEDSNQTTITNGSTASANNSASDAGAAYVFRRSGANWTHEAYLKAPNAEGNDQFGTSLSISGDTIVVGARGEDSNQTTITNGSTASADNLAATSGAADGFDLCEQLLFIARHWRFGRHTVSLQNRPSWRHRLLVRDWLFC